MIVITLVVVFVICVLVGLQVRVVPRYDPVVGCKLYKDDGCAHVDGYLCDFPDCQMLKEYLESENV